MPNEPSENMPILTDRWQPPARQMETRPQLEALESALSHLRDKALSDSIQLSYCVFDPSISDNGNTVFFGDEERTFSASLAKVPLAHMAVALLDPDTIVRIPNAWVAQDGTGEFDNVTDDGSDRQVTVGQLVTDLLSRSGNTAYRLLGRLVGVDRLTAEDRVMTYYQDHGWENTTVEGNDDEDGPGFLYIGDTTPRDALRQFASLFDDDVEELRGRPLLQIARDALVQSKVHDHGIRQNNFSSDVVIANKTADYDFDDGEEQNVRHDVGFVEVIDKMGESHRTYYCVMGSSLRLHSGIDIDDFVAQFGQNIIDYTQSLTTE